MYRIFSTQALRSTSIGAHFTVSGTRSTARRHTSRSSDSLIESLDALDAQMKKFQSIEKNGRCFIIKLLEDDDKAELQAVHERIDKLEKELTTRIEKYHKFIDEEQAKVHALGQGRLTLKSLQDRCTFGLLFRNKSVECIRVKGAEWYPNWESLLSKSALEPEKSKPNESEPTEVDYKKFDVEESESKELDSNKSEAEESDYDSDCWSVDSDWSDPEDSNSEKSDVEEMPPVKSVPEKVETQFIIPKEDLMVFQEKLVWISYMVTASASIGLLSIILFLLNQMM